MPSSNGCRFYINFIDDFNKFSWLYPLVQKSDAYNAFLKFKLQVENLFGCKIKNFQTDGGTEYLPLKPLFSIIHRLSCPYTTEQNGCVERKHHHIMETGLTLLAHASMPSNDWDEAFQTAVFFNNRISSSNTNNKSPFKILFNWPPDCIMLKTFGCLCDTIHEI